MNTKIQHIFMIKNVMQMTMSRKHVNCTLTVSTVTVYVNEKKNELLQ